MRPCLLVDIGNSRVKWRQLRDGVKVDSGAMPTAQQDAWRFPPLIANGQPCVIAGVVPAAAVDVVKVLTELGYEPRVLSNRDVLANATGFHTTVRNPDAIGIDRLLASLAAWKHRNVDFPNVIAVSVGTAVTVDFVLADGTHLGGAILPGYELMAQALNRNTALLPDIATTMKHDPGVAGLDTFEAIHVGITAAICGAVDRLISRFRAVHGKATVCLGGGGGHILTEDLALSHTQSRTIRSDNFALDGLAIVANKILASV